MFQEIYHIKPLSGLKVRRVANSQII